MSMDGHHHLANVAHFHNELQQRGSMSRSSASTSTSTAGGAGTGSSPAQGQPQEIDFTLPNVRPGLAKLGRRLTEMSENFLYDEPKTSASPGPSSSKRASRASLELATPVPFMGDEPVFCPFCNKPLPPALLLTHMSAAVEQEEQNKANPRVAESAGMSKTASAPVPATPTKQRPQPQLQHKPSGLSASRPTSPQPKATSAQLASSVKEADNVDATAGKMLVETDDLRRWSKIAGIELDLPKGPVETNTANAASTAKPFPKIAPPPEDQARSSSRNSSRFNLFGGKTKGKQDDDDEDESDDDFAGAGGYAKLDAPASPEREEKELPGLSAKRGATAPQAGEADETTAGSTPEVVQAESEPEPASEAEVRAVLKEVLTRINDIAKSHASVLHSHSTLLTTLKIARSNLAMAEANAEMLEEQLKQQTKAIAKAPPSATAATSSKPGASGSSMGPPSSTTRPAPTRTATTGPGAGEGSKAASSTEATPAASRRSAETTRPMSIQIPSSTTNPRPQQGSANSIVPGSAVSASSESKGMFGSFWNRNKDKVDTFMSSLPDFTPVAEKSSFDFARSPVTPYGAALPEQYRSPASATAPGLNRSKTVHGRAGGDSEGLTRSSSYTNVLNAPAGPKPKPQQQQAPSDPYTQELTRLRNLHNSAQAKIESMSKELADLKKGKLDMEAELENLSQALFEEANKMVADEKKKRAELEESLKEVKEEREALRETIKVLGGQVEDQNSSRGDANEEQDDLGDLPEFQPRDLDKHYEALRKSIHHVADGAEWNRDPSPTAPGNDAPQQVSSDTNTNTNTPLPPRRHSLPDIASPEPQRPPALHDPWADSAPEANKFSNNVFKLQPLSRANDEDVGPTDTTTTTITPGGGLGLATSGSGSGSPTAPERPKSSASTRSTGPISPKAEKLDALDEMMEKMQADVELESPKKDKAGL